MFIFAAIEDVGKVRTFENAAVLPWGVPADRQQAVWSEDVTPGEFVLRTLFAEFTILAERKIDLVLGEPLVRVSTRKQTSWLYFSYILATPHPYL